MELKIDKAGGVCTITLNRPDVFNSFNESMAKALQSALDDCENDDGEIIGGCSGTQRRSDRCGTPAHPSTA